MLKLLEYKRPRDYFGNDYDKWLTFPVGLTRDSDALTTSNFYAAWKRLSGKEYDPTTDFDEDDEKNKVIITRAHHWACGWVESIRIRTNAIGQVTAAEGLLKRLNDYPVLDEDLYYSLRVELGEDDDDDEGDNNDE